MNTMKLIELLLQHGYSKYKIAKLVGVSWATVRLWERGVFEATEEHRSVLDSLIERGDF